jgi:MFS family permease
MLRVQLAWAAVATASWVTTVSLTVVAYDAGGTPAVALAVLVRAAAAAALGPVAGALLDRAPRSRSMSWAAAVCAAATAGAALAGDVLIAVLLLTTVVSVGVLVFRAAQSAVLPELVDDPADLTAANVLSTSAESVGLFAGPALAGLLLALHGSGLSFAVTAVLFASAWAALTGTRVSRRSPGPRREDTSRASTRELLRLPAPRLLLPLVLAQTVVGGGVVVLSAALVVGPLDADIGAVGALNSAFGLGCVLGSLGLFALAGSARLGAWTAGALLLWGAPLLLVPLAPELALVVALLVVVGVGNVVFDVTAVTLLQRAVPGRLTGRAFAVLETVVVLGSPEGRWSRLRSSDWWDRPRPSWCWAPAWSSCPSRVCVRCAAWTASSPRRPGRWRCCSAWRRSRSCRRRSSRRWPSCCGGASAPAVMSWCSRASAVTRASSSTAASWQWPSTVSR